MKLKSSPEAVGFYELGMRRGALDIFEWTPEEAAEFLKARRSLAKR